MPDIQVAQPTLKDLIESRKEAIAAVIPKHLNADRIIKVALVAVSKTPKLQQCNQMSILRCVMQAAEIGLEPGGVLGEAHLVPYNTKEGWQAQLIVDYKGMIELSRRSGQLLSIKAVPVFEGEPFTYKEGLETVLEHEPNLDAVSTDPSKLRGVYVVAHLANNTRHVEWMNKGQIDGIRARSKAGNFGPWKTDYIEMAKKTVIRRAWKMLPKSSEMLRAVEVMDTTEGFIEHKRISEPQRSRTEALLEHLTGDGDVAELEMLASEDIDPDELEQMKKDATAALQKQESEEEQPATRGRTKAKAAT